MFGIRDPWVWSAMLLCLVSAAICVIYGALTWNRGEEALREEDVQWAREEKEIEEEF